MKKDDKISVELSKEKVKINNLGIFCQIVLIILVLILIIMGIFIPLELVLEATLSLLLFVTAYNNYKTYKRKYFTLIYTLGGILVIALTIYSVLNGI